MIDRTQVVELYTTPLQDGSMRRLEDVAAMLGVHPSTIAYHLRQAGVARRPKGQSKIFAHHRAEIVRQYTTRLPDGTWKGSTLIAQDLGISDVAVQLVLRQEGIPIRSAKESHAHGKRCGPIKHTEQFDAPPLCACGCGKPVRWLKNKMGWARYVEGHYQPDAPYKSEDWLREQYEVRRRNLPEIAAEFGVQVSTIVHQMERLGIERRATKESLIGVQAGANNPAWKGGTTPERQRLYKTQEWKALVKSIYERDGFTCQRCKQGVSGTCKRAAAAHHIKSWSDYPELRREPSNLITLCRTCHEWVHSLDNVNRDFLG